MEKNFIKVRSAKDIIVCATLITAGTILVLLPTSDSLNILGFFIAVTGLLLGIFMKSGDKDTESGKNYCKSEIYVDKAACAQILKDISVKLCAETLKAHENGNGMRLDIYYSKSLGKAYVQLFEYIPYKYEACTPMYEHSVENLSDIIK